MPLSPFEHDRRHGELDQVIRAYAGEPADDTPDKPSQALTAYLRHTWHTRPWALATAETQLREYARNPPGRLRLRLGEFYVIPDVGLPEQDIQQWLSCLADHIKRSVETGAAPPPATPVTVDDYAAGIHPQLVARLVGELRELLALDLDESDHALAVAELGMEVDPPAPYSPGAWLTLVAERLESPRADADYGPDTAH
ncbi:MULTISPECIES: contact-dependent growth inhibition system immunity protein [Streptomyces]|uniref:Contact-dependent growth inhibition system immunity protein n=1 Tax=Streptomyces kaempferi TaxID=333725 RepID=A0ABW3XGB7_9ACTN